MQAAFSVQIVESFTIYFKIICSLLVLSQLFSVLIYPMNTAHRNMTINITHTFFFFFSFRERVVTWGGGVQWRWQREGERDIPQSPTQD